MELWHTKKDRPFWETIWMRYINEHKYSRKIYSMFWDLFWVELSGKLKTKFKTVQHYLIHNEEREAWHQLKQFMDAVENFYNLTNHKNVTNK